MRVTVPDALRTGHEAHFAEVTTALPRIPEASGFVARLGEGQHAERNTPSPRGAPRSASRGDAPEETGPGGVGVMAERSLGIDLRTRSGPGVLYELTGVIARHQGDITSVEILPGEEAAGGTAADESRVYFEIRLPGEPGSLLDELRSSPSVRSLEPVLTMTRVYGKRIIIVGGGAQVGQVAIGAISEADRHNIRGEHISVDTIPLVGEKPLAEAVRAVTRLPRARALVLAGSLMGGEIEEAVREVRGRGLIVISLNMAGSVPEAADLVVTDPVQAGVMAVMAVADTAKFTVDRLKRRVF